ncbi:MAG: FHA domain-containing protein [Myxococcota bacterium]
MSESPSLVWAFSVLRVPSRSTLERGLLVGIPHRECRVGRSSDNDVVLDDRTVSRVHARLRPSEEGVEVEALTPSTGTFVDRRRLELGDSVLIEPRKSRLQLGGVLLQLVPQGRTEPVFSAMSTGASVGQLGVERRAEALLAVTHDGDACAVRFAGRPLLLGGTPAKLLGLLAGAPGHVVHRWDLEHELGTARLAPPASEARAALAVVLADDAEAASRVSEHLQQMGRVGTGASADEVARRMIESRRGHGYLLNLDPSDVSVRTV